MILVAPKQETASWFPKLLELSQEDPIPLYAEGQPLLTQDVILPDGETEAHHYRPSNLHVETLQAILRAKGHSWEAADIMSRSLCQSNHHYKCMNHIGEDSSIFVGQNDGRFSISEVIISVPISCIYSETDCFHRPSYHIARQWLNSVMRHWKYDPAADPRIKLLIRAFRLERPVQRRIMPKWDLHLVLLALMSPPFTSDIDDRGRISDDVIDLKWRTMKTVFLLAFASARRWSYLHAFSVAHGRCVFGRGNTQR